MSVEGSPRSGSGSPADRSGRDRGCFVRNASRCPPGGPRRRGADARIERNRRAARTDEGIALLIIADRGVFSGPGCMGSVAESRRVTPWASSSRARGCDVAIGRRRVVLTASVIARGRDFDGLGGGPRGARLRHRASGRDGPACERLRQPQALRQRPTVQPERSRGDPCRVGRRVWGNAGTTRPRVASLRRAIGEPGLGNRRHWNSRMPKSKPCRWRCALGGSVPPEAVENVGPEALQTPDVRHLGVKRRELRVGSEGGIARGNCVTATGRRVVVVLHVFASFRRAGSAAAVACGGVPPSAPFTPSRPGPPTVFGETRSADVGCAGYRGAPCPP